MKNKKTTTFIDERGLECYINEYGFKHYLGETIMDYTDRVERKAFLANGGKLDE